MTKKEEFDELYKYVKFKILEYDENIRLPRYFILRLQGLSKGNFISNKRIKPMASYTYTEILYTFKFCSVNIKRAIANRDRFKDEQHLFNTIMVIVEKEINNVVNRLRNIKKIEEKADTIEIFERKEDIEYSKQDDDKSEVFKDKVKNLW